MSSQEEGWDQLELEFFAAGEALGDPAAEVADQGDRGRIVDVVTVSESASRRSGRMRVAALVAWALQRWTLRRPSLGLAAICLVFLLGAGVPTAGVSANLADSLANRTEARDRTSPTGPVRAKSGADRGMLSADRAVHRHRSLRRGRRVHRVVGAVPREHRRRRLRP
jgi:hypothetical protein